MNPAETAPKDGREIVVFSGSTAKGYLVKWCAEGTSWNDSCNALVQTGVWEVVNGDGWFEPGEVTHWMSPNDYTFPPEALPAAPGAEVIVCDEAGNVQAIITGAKT